MVVPNRALLDAYKISRYLLQGSALVRVAEQSFPGSLVIPVKHSSRARSCIGAKPLKRNLAASDPRRSGWSIGSRHSLCDIISRFSIIELSIMTKADTDT